MGCVVRLRFTVWRGNEGELVEEDEQEEDEEKKEKRQEQG